MGAVVSGELTRIWQNALHGCRVRYAFECVMDATAKDECPQPCSTHRTAPHPRLGSGVRVFRIDDGEGPIRASESSQWSVCGAMSCCTAASPARLRLDGVAHTISKQIIH